MAPARQSTPNVAFVRIIILIFSVCCLLSSALTPVAQAQTPNAGAAGATFGVARMIEVKAKDIKNGSLISTSKEGAVLTTLAYDPQILGVVAQDAAIVLNSTGTQNAVPIISTGTVYVQVSSKDGAIKKGDLLTSSIIPGVATKALKDGYVIGFALEDYSSSDPNKPGLIAADLDLHYFNAKPTLAGALSDIFKIALLPTKEGPSAIFKYIIAAAVVLGSLVLGFMSFGRTAAKGVEALGRNPAASKIIHLGIIFNVAIVAVIGLVGLTIAFLILRL